MSYGYDSAFVLSNSVADIDASAMALNNRLDGERQSGAAKRPLIFVAHSLGGIIVKRALILTNERSDHWQNIRDSAAGIVFFAVPHRGADIAYWATLTANALTFATLGAMGNARFVKALKRNSPEFSRISQAFIQPATRFKIIRTFYETSKIGNQIIVDKDSASLGLGNEIAVPIDGATHRDICKFGDDKSQKYRPVYNALDAIVAKINVSDPVQTSVLHVALKQSNLVQQAWQENIGTLSDQDECCAWITSLNTYQSWSSVVGNKILQYNSGNHYSTS
ncbi:hypothetical protein CJF30_00010308 [Rutstroemia sp. NJR-2017a BBW]|nr:hypothetical protein CJF30_00010308 [Rutstroemia sp. NJR-2017a BBW]